MAIVRDITVVDGSGKLHPTEAEARVRVFGHHEKKPFIQIDTFGSKQREIPGKLSQTIQFDERSSRQLFEILRKTYGFE